ncbi:MAG: toxin-antitoxin system, antitoxin component [Capnocytophaga sp.]|nr:toxin-antitoxin system, antitoxin component [Capnocytophaga sp.]
MNVIPLKRNLSFQEYQLAVKVLEDLGVEIGEPGEADFFYDLSKEELQILKISDEEIKAGKVVSEEEVNERIKAIYENKMD